MTIPEPILLKRIANELKDCTSCTSARVIPELGNKLPITVEFKMENVPGYETRDKIVTTHIFTITFTKSYGIEKPEIRWKTHIFHPNIMDPDDGGFVCTKMLNNWEFNNNLLGFLKGLEVLVATPNYKNPFGTESCMAAAEFFRGNVSKFSFRVVEG